VLVEKGKKNIAFLAFEKRIVTQTEPNRTKPISLVRIHFLKTLKTEPIEDSLVRASDSLKTDPNRYNYTPT
jgi:hypothetical protein